MPLGRGPLQASPALRTVANGETQRLCHLLKAESSDAGCPPGPQRGCEPAACGAESMSLPSDGLCHEPGAGLRSVQVTLLTPPTARLVRTLLLLHRAGPGSERAGNWLKVTQLIADSWVLGQHCESKHRSLSIGQFFLLLHGHPQCNPLIILSR